MIASQVRILVVDDERNIRNNLTMVLEASGYMVDASNDGEDALTKCKTRHYDIAFVDPPYESRMLDRVIEGWQVTRFSRILAVEHATTHTLPPGALLKRFEDTSVSFYGMQRQ